MAQLDDQDRDSIAARMARYDKHTGPREGDWVDFAGGARQRISYVWPDGVQTSAGGGFYLGTVRDGSDAYVSFSGSLDPQVPRATLQRTEETRPGAVWMFHHDHWYAGNGVHSEVPFRVYRCSLPTPRCWTGGHRCGECGGRH